MLSRFDRIPERVGHTDGRTGGQKRYINIARHALTRETPQQNSHVRYDFQLKMHLKLFSGWDSPGPTAGA